MTAKTKPTEMDFSRLDQRGEPSISFEPESPQRAEMLKTLARKPSDAARKELVKKIGREFARIYTRYRKQAEAVLGLRPSIYTIQVPDKDMRFAAEAGVECVMYGVTPGLVLEYWHKHIRTFANRGMLVPPIALLTRPGMIDQVACSTLDGKTLNKPTPRESFSSKPATARANPGGLRERGHSCDETEIHPGLRKYLQSTGNWDMRDFNDRYLWYIQNRAQYYMENDEIFMDKADRKMIILSAKFLESVGVEGLR